MAIVRPIDFKNIKMGTSDFEFEMDIINPDDLNEKELKQLILG
jgi:hypothetical protein